LVATAAFTFVLVASYLVIRLRRVAA
jgi:hypothetical protein